MHRNDTHLQLLRVVLENALQPRRLDAHPWTKSLIVIQAKIDMPNLLDKSPGQQLVAAVARLFCQMMPATPPKGENVWIPAGESSVFWRLNFFHPSSLAGLLRPL